MNQRDTLITDLNVLADFHPQLPQSFRSANYLMLGNLTPEVQMDVLNQMTRRPKLVVLDTMNFWMDVAMDGLLDVLKKVDVITINDEEARQLSGEYSLVAAAAKIHKLGPKYLILKKGEHGVMLFREGGCFLFLHYLWLKLLIRQAPEIPLQVDLLDIWQRQMTFPSKI